MSDDLCDSKKLKNYILCCQLSTQSLRYSI